MSVEKETTEKSTTTSSERELTLTRIINAPPEKVFKAWTDPALLKQWFVPKPWTVASAKLDVRPGGSCLVVMRSPEGKESPIPGIYLEVVPNKKIVFTDAFTKAWEPSQKQFMTAVVTFDDFNGKPRYTARVLHWTSADREVHEKMGFHQGWSTGADQLAALVSGA